MKPEYFLPLIANILWLFVGGILGFWIGKSELPWIIVAILIFVIGSLVLTRRSSMPGKNAKTRIFPSRSIFRLERTTTGFQSFRHRGISLMLSNSTRSASDAIDSSYSILE